MLKGCLDDSDCSEYGTECSTDGINKHTCVLKDCPALHVENGMVQTQEKKVKDTSVLSCNNGFIFKNPASYDFQKSALKNVTLLCSINNKGITVWVETRFTNTEFEGECVEGINIAD